MAEEQGMRYSVTGEEGKVIGFYELNPFPGCNQMVVSNHAYIIEEERNKGYGKAAHAKRVAEAKRLGYDCMICTVKGGNDAQDTILIWFGWTKVFSFVNKETGNRVYVWMLDLNKL